MAKKQHKSERRNPEPAETSADRKPEISASRKKFTPQKTTPAKKSPRKKFPKLTAEQRILLIEGLTDEERFTVHNADQAAGFLGVKVRQFQNYLAQGCPGRPARPGHHDGILYLPEILVWCKENIWKKQARNATPYGEDEFGDPMVPVGDANSSPALERYREAKANLAELDLAERKGLLVDVSKIHTAMVGIAQTLRLAGEQIARINGNGPVEILNEALTEIEEQIAEHFDREEEDGEEEEGESDDFDDQ